MNTTTLREQLVSCRVISSERHLLQYLDEKYGAGNYEIKVAAPFFCPSKFTVSPHILETNLMNPQMQHNCYHILYPDSQDPLTEVTPPLLPGLAFKVY